MKQGQMLTLPAFLLLAACSGSIGAGDLRIDTLPANVEEDCPPPSRHLGAGDWEIIAGRIGDDLIECAAEKKIAVDAYNGVRTSVGPQ